MKQRIITAAFILAATIPILAFSRYIEYPIVLSLLAAIGVFEILRVLSLLREYLVMIPAFLIALAAPVLPYCVYLFPREEKVLSADEVRTCLMVLALVYFALLLYLFAVAVFRHGHMTVADIATLFFMVVYVVTSFTAMSLIRYMQNGVYAFALIFIAAWISDVFAYFIGSFFGRHKLIPEVSPKKTVEGSIGGIVFATAAFVL